MKGLAVSSLLTMALVLAPLASTDAMAAGPRGGDDIYISELLVNPPGSDDLCEFLELKGPADHNLWDCYFIVIEGDGTGAGTVDQVVDLSGNTTGSNGLLLVAIQDLLPAPDPATSVYTYNFTPDLENGTNTYIVGFGEVPAVGDDLDKDNDCALDPGALDGFTVTDAVSYTDGGGGDCEYADDVGGTALGIVGSYTPDALYRIFDYTTGLPHSWAGGDVNNDCPGPWNWDKMANFGWDAVGVTNPENLTLDPGNSNYEYGGPQPTGACCFPDGSCQETTAGTCGGVYLGDGTTCDPNPCPQPPTGACCRGIVCTIETEFACTLDGGVYQGDETTCDPNPCLAVTGACCLPDFTCLEDQLEADCLALSGTWHEGATCAVCPAPALLITEIMYNPASQDDNHWEYIEVLNNESATVGLTGYVLDDDDGDPYLAANILGGSIPAGGTAVFFDGDNNTVAAMEAAWGVGINFVPVTNWSAYSNSGDRVGLWHNFAAYDAMNFANAVQDISYTDDPPWPADDGVASIYLLNVTYDNTDGANWHLSVAGYDNAYESNPAGTNLAINVGSPGLLPNDTPPVGACCVGTVCSIELEDVCEAIPGEFQGVGTTCDPNPCLATGACCVGTVCSVITEIECVTAHGTYLGDDTLCDPNPCHEPVEGFFLTELLINAPDGGDDGREFVELQGPAESSLLGYWFITIEGDGTVVGTIDQLVNLGTYASGSNGLLLIRDADTVLLPAPAAETNVVIYNFNPDIENGSNTYVLAVGTPLFNVGDDLDVDDDCALDAGLPGLVVVDAVSYADSSLGDCEYADDLGGTALGPFMDYTPDALYRVLDCDGTAPHSWAGGDVTATANLGPFYWEELENFGWAEVGVSDPQNRTLDPGNLNYQYCPVLVCRGDSNCDDAINWRDIDYFVAAMNDNVAAWEAMFLPGSPTCPFENNDVNADGTVNWRDIDPFVAVMNTTCP
ncbi:MAG: lamin tail domain-containing protein [Phycisphaerae bacterium]|nr:lamin tail domain-containing protein [Phycisphaerae bacterium]